MKESINSNYTTTIKKKKIASNQQCLHLDIIRIVSKNFKI